MAVCCLCSGPVLSARRPAEVTVFGDSPGSNSAASPGLRRNRQLVDKPVVCSRLSELFGAGTTFELRSKSSQILPGIRLRSSNVAPIVSALAPELEDTRSLVEAPSVLLKVSGGALGEDGSSNIDPKESLNNAVQAVTDGIDSSSTQESLNNAVQAVTDGIDSSSTQESLNNAVQGVTDGIDSSSTQESLNNAVQGFTDGIDSSSTQESLNNAVQGFTDGIDSSSTQDTLNNAVQGLTDGIDSSTATDNIVKAAAENGSSGDAVLSAKEKYLQSIGGGFKQPEDEDLFGGLKDVQDFLTNSVDNLVKSLTSAFNGSGNAGKPTNPVDNLVKSVTSAFDGAGNAVKSSYETVNGSLDKLLKSATGPANNGVSEIRSNVGGTKAPSVSGDIDFTAPFRMGTPANDALRDVVIVVKDVTGKALVTAGGLISDFYATTKDSLPDDTVVILNDIEDKISQVSKPLGGVLNEVYAVVVEAEKAAGIDPENPVIPVILVLGGTLFISISWFQSKYGGYTGDLQPSEALELLKKEGNVVLVDVRPQELRESEGIPDLRRSTRYKFAAIDVLKAEKSVRGQLKNASEVDNLLTAAVIRNLKNVNRETNIIVLDEDGSQSKEIARGLRKSGTKRAYRVEGGYKAWAKEGLRSKADAPQTPLIILKEEAEAILEEVKPTVAGVIGVTTGLVAGTYALLEWEKTLQLIGVIGLATTVYLRVESYDNIEDLKADIRLVQKPFRSLIQGILLLTGQAEKRELQLATSPASSAIQGRMLQAAAKHGAASEKEQGEVVSSDTTEVSEDEYASAVDDSELNQSHSASGSQQEPPPTTPAPPPQ